LHIPGKLRQVWDRPLQFKPLRHIELGVEPHNLWISCADQPGAEGGVLGTFNVAELQIRDLEVVGFEIVPDWRKFFRAGAPQMPDFDEKEVAVVGGENGVVGFFGDREIFAENEDGGKEHPVKFLRRGDPPNLKIVLEIGWAVTVYKHLVYFQSFILPVFTINDRVFIKKQCLKTTVYMR
jgi:hypothetical protein